MAQLDLNDVAVFVRVLQRGGFSAAARELGVPVSTVSRTVARLEEAMDVRLVQRTTRSFAATAEGRAFFEEAAPAVAALEQASRAAGANSEPHGRLRVTAPADLANTFVAQVVTEYIARYPNVTVELDLTSRVVDLVAEGFDVAVRAGSLPDSSLVARKIGPLATIVVASPGYLRAHGTPKVPADLAAHDAVLFKFPGGTTAWTLQGPAGESTVQVQARIVADDFTFVRAATLDGAGIALLPRLFCVSDIESGRLTRVLPLHESVGGQAYVVYPSTKQVPAKVAAFRELVVEVFARAEATCQKAVKKSG